MSTVCRELTTLSEHIKSYVPVASAADKLCVCREAQASALELLRGQCRATAQLLSAFTQTLGEPFIEVYKRLCPTAGSS